MLKRGNYIIFIMAMADLLSLIRIPIAILFAYALVKSNLLISLLLFLLGSFSDFLDGYLSRKIGKSKYGYLLDPIADRLFIGISFLSLYFVPLKNDISLFLALIIVGQDLLLSPVGFYASMLTIKKRKSLKSLITGKIATFSQYFFVIFVLLINIISLEIFLPPLEILVACLSIASGLHHLYVWLHILLHRV